MDRGRSAAGRRPRALGRRAGGQPRPSTARRIYLRRRSQPVPWTRVASLADLQTYLKAPGKTVMLDFYADWCVSCKEMEAFTFSDPSARAARSNAALQADVTANTDEDKALLKRFSLFGPPGIIFFDAEGREINAARSATRTPSAS